MKSRILKVPKAELSSYVYVCTVHVHVHALLLIRVHMTDLGANVIYYGAPLKVNADISLIMYDNIPEVRKLLFSHTHLCSS